MVKLNTVSEHTFYLVICFFSKFILMDAGGTIEPNQVVEGITTLFNPQTYHLFPTGAAELMRPHLPDCLAFISDIHTVHKVSCLF